MFRVPVLDESCCQMSLRKGTVIISVSYIVWFAAAAAWNGIVKDLYGFGDFDYTWRYIMLSVNIVIIVLSVLQLVGISLKIEMFTFLWILTAFFHFLLNVVSGILAMMLMFKKRQLEVCILYCVLIFAYVVITLYLLLIVASYYEYFDEQNGVANQDLDPERDAPP